MNAPKDNHSPDANASAPPPQTEGCAVSRKGGIFGRVFTAVATLGPLGVKMPAPGTWGSAAGVLLYAVVFASFNHLASWYSFLGLAVAFNAFGILVCHVAEKHIGRTDPGEVIFDEFAAIPLAYIGAESFLRGGSAWAWFLAGFALFRLFDILKPFGIRKLQTLPGGLGIVVDDVAAALVACVGLHLLHFVATIVGIA